MNTFQPEDRVRFLHQTGEGTVIRQDGDICIVEDTDGFECPIHASELVKVPSDSLKEQQRIASYDHLSKKEQRKGTKKEEMNGGKGSQVIEVDLHQKALRPFSNKLSPVEIHELQLRTIVQTLDSEKRHPGKKIIFIHGKGDGTLRQELIKELKRRSSYLKYEDAPFHKYGINGATKVTIKQNKT